MIYGLYPQASPTLFFILKSGKIHKLFMSLDIKRRTLNEIECERKEKLLHSFYNYAYNETTFSMPTCKLWN